MAPTRPKTLNTTGPAIKQVDNFDDLLDYSDDAREFHMGNVSTWKRGDINECSKSRKSGFDLVRWTQLWFHSFHVIHSAYFIHFPSRIDVFQNPRLELGLRGSIETICRRPDNKNEITTMNFDGVYTGNQWKKNPNIEMDTVTWHVPTNRLAALQNGFEGSKSGNNNNIFLWSESMNRPVRPRPPVPYRPSVD